MDAILRRVARRQPIKKPRTTRGCWNRPSLDDCPPEVIGLILMWIGEESLESLVSLMLVCKKIKMVADSSTIWQIAYCARWRPEGVPIQDWKMALRERMRLRRKWSQNSVTVSTLDGHTDSVYCVEFVHGKIFTVSRDRTLRVWNNDYQLLSTYESGHSGSVLTISAGYDVIATGGSDGKVILRSLGDLDIMWQGILHENGILSIAIGPERCATASKDGSIVVVNTRGYRVQKVIRNAHMGKPVSSLAYDPSTNAFYSAGGDGKIYMWDADRGIKLSTFRGHKSAITCLRICGPALVSGASDHTVRVWDIRSRKCKYTLRGHKNIVRSVDLSGGRIVSASYDRAIKVWDYANGSLLYTYNGWHDGWIYCVRATASAIISTSVSVRPIIFDFS